MTEYIANMLTKNMYMDGLIEESDESIYSYSIDNLLISQNLYSKNYKIDADWENLINKYLKCRKLNKELADAFVDKVQVFEGGRISVNLVYDDCLEELLQVKNKREGDLNE